MVEPNEVTVPGLTIAAPRSGAGKTMVALGLMRALTEDGLQVQPFKNGPDYIDPAFHRVATGRDSYNVDSWAMSRDKLSDIAGLASNADLSILEGSMGLFDGAAIRGAHAIGATRDIAAQMGWPVVLVLDVSGQAQSAAATALGCAGLHNDINVAAIIINQVASPRHELLVRQAIESAGFKVVGSIARQPELQLPERHLGLVQASETAGLSDILDQLARLIRSSCDVPAIKHCADAKPVPPRSHGTASLRPPGQRVALAHDVAFSFIYPHLVADWRAQGAELVPFSPLRGEGPNPACDFCWLPGGYPELHAGQLAHNGFIDKLVAFANDKPVHGECGGYMVLGQGLIDRQATRHPMAGLLSHATSFAQRKLNLGYRAAELVVDCALGDVGDVVRGHEFHYASVVEPGDDTALVQLTDGQGNALGKAGGKRGSISGSFFHVIARDDR